ncbi:MAG: hypothetical protein WA814_05115 [Candidatus Baltobacteraceae bacterium]
MRALALLIAAGMILGVPGVARGGEVASPAKTVAAFFDWYLAQHGQAGKHLTQARRFFDSDLYDGLEDAYFKGDEYTGDISVSLCAHDKTPPNCKNVRYDPFTNDSSSAASYGIGPTRIQGNEATVSVTLRLSRNSRVESHISAVLVDRGGRFVISNLLYEPRGYYYAGPIVNLTKFLGGYNC